MNDNQLLSRKLVILGRQIRHKRNLFVGQIGLTSEQADALRFFADYPHSTITDFKSHQQITHQTARLIVKRLVERKLLRLDANPNDGRAKLVCFTTAGVAKRQQMDAHLKTTGQVLFGGFTMAEQQQLLAMLKRVDENLERD